ncbi:MAG TPA: hypothetical protein VHQ93_16800 [Chitinophagaceae bacterium]|jgi:hypothetical protein|nr:hypothetical protein [Chitinophagaceae bacterium]
MERQFNNGDFEKLLRDNANQYRMYPSEKVWKGIHSALHTRRRWYGLSAAIMFLLTGSVVSIFIYSYTPAKNNSAELKINSIQNSNQQQVSTTSSKETKTFTPALNNLKPVDPSTANLTGSYLNGPAFNLPTGDDMRSGLNVNNNVSNTQAQEATESTVPNRNETIDPPYLSTDLNLLKQNGFIETEDQSLNNILPDDKNITEQSTLNENTEKQINNTISALASQNVLLPKPGKRSKVTAQVYFTPTVSYRKLTENKKVYPGGFYVPAIDLKNIVKHKPGMGLEFGIEGKYQMDERLSIKTGLQFNINRYDIRAYSHPTEIATVALSGNYGRVDSLASLSNYRNFSGSSPNWLENFYFQAAIPVGVEYIISDNNNIQWGVSGTIQPTYVIGDRAYVISSDYKNYAKFPDLMRRWNISTGIGTFVSYSTGRIKWQVGPHLRYQHMSSFVNALTVKEKLYAVGLKVGATLNSNKK